MFEEVPSIKDSKTDEKRTTRGRAIGVHVRAPQAETGKLAEPSHGRALVAHGLCACARAAVRRAGCVISLFFRSLYCSFASF